MNRKTYFLTVIVFLLIGNASMVAAEENQLDPSTKSQRFKLFFVCVPLSLVVEDVVGPDAKRIGLTKTRIVTMAEAKLRSARLFRDDLKPPFLYIGVNLLDMAFAVEVALLKPVKDYYFPDLDGLVKTWSESTLGTQNSDSSFILSQISELVDQFIVEYFRANEGTCK